MYNGKSFIGIIPARGGSKGLPEKNIKKLNGKPLIAWSIDSASKSLYLDDVIVTTDDEKIKKISLQYGAKVPFMRPAELATDTATSADVVKHVINFYLNQGMIYDYIVLLEPTSPLRKDNDIDLMIEKIGKDNECHSIVSVGEVNLHPSLMKKINKNGTISNFSKESDVSKRRQDYDPAFFPFGVAYIVSVKFFLSEMKFYTEGSIYHKIERYQCYEIDDIYDFLAVENIIKYNE